MQQLQPKRFDGTGLLRSPAFWALHFQEQTGGRLFAEDFFNFSQNDLEVFWRKELSDSVPGEPDKYPRYCFVFPTPGGYSVSAEYRCYPEDYGLDYYIRHPSWEQPRYVGTREGHFALPAFRWSEIVRVADSLQTESPALLQAALPILIPSVWPTAGDDPVEMRDRLASAWNNLGMVKQGRLGQLVSEILETDRSYDVHWRYEDDFGWINDSKYSVRNPMCNTDRSLFRQVDEFVVALFAADDA